MRRLSTLNSRGLTLLELAFVLAVAGAVVAGAMAAATRFADNMWPVSEGLRIKSYALALRHGVTAWYRAEYCGRTAKPAAVPLALTYEPRAPDADAEPAEACAVRVGVPPDDEVQATSCLARHVAPPIAASLPALEIDPPPPEEPREGSFTWEIVSPDEPTRPDSLWPKPQLRVFWRPPTHLQDRIEEIATVLARELGAYCDDDGDADTAEACDGEPAAIAGPTPAGTDPAPVERFVWAAPIGSSDAAGTDLGQAGRLRDWLSAHALDCNADRMSSGPDMMDPFCDGPTNDELIPTTDELGADGIHVIDANSDGCDDARARPPFDTAHPRHRASPVTDQPCIVEALVDGDENGLPDFDSTGDFVVDSADFYAIGCW